MPAAGATTTTKCHQEKRERAMKTSWCSDKMWAPVIYHHRMGTGPVGFFFFSEIANFRREFLVDRQESGRNGGFAVNCCDAIR
jgi:hypothetical protein